MYEKILYVIYECFGGACAERQALELDEVTPEVLDELVEEQFLRRVELDETTFLVVRHPVYVAAGNANQNYRLTAYNLRKSCLLADFWLLTHHSVVSILALLTQGTMYQHSLGPWDEQSSYLHSQDCYAYCVLPEDKARHFVWFPKTQDPLTLSRNIKKFFDTEGAFDDIDELSPHLHVRVASEKMRDAVLSKFDGHYWWIRDRLDFFILNNENTRDLV